ncbi:hypothetical protein HHK36_024676 [Tetracentron sinense]|uniref:Uncharacterized protein n=1 Tax=Tetracentron sinense TaxID=13715 RepID=A0A835D7P9_TETSI|nr:hypothetical protein HHK36_024676 [Tetracentron sinense]
MDTAAAAPTFKTVNVLASSATRRLTNPTAITPSWPSTRPHMLALYVCNPNPRNNVHFLTRCSSKPDVDSENATTKSPTVEPDSNSKTQQLSTPPPNQKPSSSSSSRGLVFDLGTKNSWDSAEIGSPVVKRYLSDDEERWYMWYHGSSDANPTSDSIGLAVSSNGVHWERGTGLVRSSGEAGLVMNCSMDWWAFDTESIRPSEVVVMSSSKVRASSAVYWLYYTGFSSEKVELSGSLKLPLENPERTYHGGTDRIFKSLPGLAISQDGRHWARIEGEHHTGALFDLGSGKEWDSLFASAPRVVYHGTGDLRMYYHSFDAECGHFALGIARSRDGIKWVKLGKIIGGGPDGSFDEFGAANAHVVRNRKNGEYVMVYEGVAADGQRSIGLAVSPDGLKDWKKCQDEAILKPSAEDAWDNKGVGSPFLVQMDGDADEWRLYYSGMGEGGRTGIGMVVSEGGDIRSFRRWSDWIFLLSNKLRILHPLHGKTVKKLKALDTLKISKREVENQLEITQMESGRRLLR